MKVVNCIRVINSVCINVSLDEPQPQLNELLLPHVKVVSYTFDIT